MTVDTETIREALDKRNMLTDACLWCGAVVEQLGGAHAISCPVAALGRAEEREAEAAKMLQDAQEMIEEHNWAPSSVNRAASVLTAVRRARAALAGSVAGEEQEQG